MVRPGDAGRRRRRGDVQMLRRSVDEAERVHGHVSGVRCADAQRPARLHVVDAEGHPPAHILLQIDGHLRRSVEARAERIDHHPREVGLVVIRVTAAPGVDLVRAGQRQFGRDIGDVAVARWRPMAPTLVRRAPVAGEPGAAVREARTAVIDDHIDRQDEDGWGCRRRCAWRRGHGRAGWSWAGRLLLLSDLRNRRWRWGRRLGGQGRCARPWERDGGGLRRE